MHFICYSLYFVLVLIWMYTILCFNFSLLDFICSFYLTLFSEENCATFVYLSLCVSVPVSRITCVIYYFSCQIQWQCFVIYLTVFPNFLKIITRYPPPLLYLSNLWIFLSASLPLY